MSRASRSVALALIVSTIASGACARAGSPFDALVVGVSDGDTITVVREREQIRIRLHGVDAPELRQAFGQRAKQFTSALIYRRDVRVYPADRDKYGRLVARVELAGGDVGYQIIAKGYAWHFTRYSSDPDYAAAEHAARQQRLGLWAEPNPTPPWEWRRANPRAD